MNTERIGQIKNYEKITEKLAEFSNALTHVPYTEARFMQSSRIKLEADDGEYHDGEEYQQADLQQRRHRLDDRLEHHLKT